VILRFRRPEQVVGNSTRSKGRSDLGLSGRQHLPHTLPPQCLGRSAAGRWLRPGLNLLEPDLVFDRLPDDLDGEFDVRSWRFGDGLVVSELGNGFEQAVGGHFNGVDAFGVPVADTAACYGGIVAQIFAVCSPCW
jgi:hypothetical protein